VVRQEPSPGAPLPVKGSSVLFELDTGGGG
jgi:hypothetical protein